MREPDEWPELVLMLRHSARRLRGQPGLSDLEAVSDVVKAAVETIPAATGGGISCIEDGTLHGSHATSTEAGKVDLLQAELNEGPCITAAASPPPDGVVIAHDLAGEDAGRWPTFAPRAVDLGWRSVLSVEMSSDDGRRSALNLYSGRPHAFDAVDAQTAGLFALQAGRLIAGAEQAAYEGRAVASRDVIGQAKGILMERFGADPEEAFQMLVSAAQDTELKLVELARWLVTEATQPAAQRRAEHAAWGESAAVEG